MDLADKLAIHELLSRVAYGYDERRLDLLEDGFAKDATMSMRIEKGELIGPFEGAPAIMKLMTDSMASQSDTRRHVVSNIFFEAETEGAATVLSNLTLISVEDGKLTVLSSGIYRDDVERRGGEWRIVRRHLDLDLPY